MYESTNAHKYSLFAFIPLLLVAFFFFYRDVTFDNTFSILLVAVTLTYSLFIGIILRLIENRYVKVREHLSFINANLVSLYNLAKLSPERFFHAITDAIDMYLITEIEARLKESWKTQEVAYRFFQSLKYFTIRQNTDNHLRSQITSIMVNFATNREIVELYSHKILTGNVRLIYWAINIITLTIFFLATLSLSHIYALLFIVYFFFFIYFMYFIKDIDDMNLGELSVKHYNRKQLFELIGKAPFCANHRYLQYNVYTLFKGQKYRIRDFNGKVVERIF